MHLSAKVIEAMEGERRVHFVNPKAVRINKSLGDAAGLKNLGVHMMTVAPGDRSSEYHCHRYEDEAIYVLSGHGTAVIGEQSYGSDREISWVFRVADRRMKRSTTAWNRWFASSSANGLRKTLSIIRAQGNGYIATAGSGTWLTWQMCRSGNRRLHLILPWLYIF